jgi:hypothetical protein
MDSRIWDVDVAGSNPVTPTADFPNFFLANTSLGSNLLDDWVPSPNILAVVSHVEYAVTRQPSKRVIPGFLQQRHLTDRNQTQAIGLHPPKIQCEVPTHRELISSVCAALRIKAGGDNPDAVAARHRPELGTANLLGPT